MPKTMRKKDYLLIARVIHGRVLEIKRTRTDCYEIINSIIYWIVNDLANKFVNDNPKFDRQKFIKACGLD